MRTATYIRRGVGRSFNAQAAEANGRLPLTRAVPVVAEALDITKTAARRLLELAGPCEWHHTGKYAKRTDYYDTTFVIAAFRKDSSNGME